MASVPYPPVSGSTLRVWWSVYYAKRATKATRLSFGGYNRDVADVSAEAWTALITVLNAHRYDWKRVGTWVVRNVAGTNRPSLHSYGIAVDINAYVPNGYPKGGTLDWGKTDFTPTMVKDILAIKNNDGSQAFGWGGAWRSGQDYMHWYLQARPSSFLTGIDWDTVNVDRVDIPPVDSESEQMEQYISAQQENLNAAGFTDYDDRALVVDGEFGKRTKSAQAKRDEAASWVPIEPVVPVVEIETTTVEVVKSVVVK